MQKKRVLFLASWYPSKINPTLGNFVQRHAEAANEYFDVTTLYITSSEFVDRTTIEENIIHGVRTLVAYYPKVNSKVPFLNNFIKYKTYLRVAQQAYSEINEEFDLVHLNIAYPAGLFALWLKKYRKLPYVLTEQWTGYLPSKMDFKRLNGIQKWQHKKIFKNASIVFPVSSHLGDELKKLGLIDSYDVLYNVVNHDIFHPVKRNSDKVRFIHVSTFDDAHKNVSGMFRVFNLMNKVDIDFEIHIVTEGSEEKVYEVAEKYDITPDQLLVSCSLDQKGVADAMRNSDCLVLFSNYETFSVVLAEAWSTGIPCVYSKCGGLTEVKNDKIGIQVEAKDEKSLFNALSQISRKEIQFNQEEIIRFSKEFHKEMISKRIEQLYLQALRNKSS